MPIDADAVRRAGELVCDCDGDAVVQLDEDGDLQEDGTILWSGCATGECPACGQVYADWWQGTFKIGEPVRAPPSDTAPTGPPTEPADEPIVADGARRVGGAFVKEDRVITSVTIADREVEAEKLICNQCDPPALWLDSDIDTSDPVAWRATCPHGHT